MADYTFQEFPKWKYNTMGPQLVLDHDEEEALGEGWFDSPELVSAPVEPSAPSVKADGGVKNPKP